MELVMINATTEASGHVTYFDENDAVNTGTACFCNGGGRRLLDAPAFSSDVVRRLSEAFNLRAGASDFDHRRHSLRHTVVSSLDSFGPGKAIWWHDVRTAAGGGGGRRRLQTSSGNGTSSVTTAFIIPSSGSGSPSDQAAQQQSDATQLTTSLNDVQSQETAGGSSPLQDGLSASGFLDGYSNSTGNNPSNLDLGLSEPIIDIPSVTPSKTVAASFSATMTATMSSTASSTASGTASATVSSTKAYDPLEWALQPLKAAGFSAVDDTTSSKYFLTSPFGSLLTQSAAANVSLGVYRRVTYASVDDCPLGRRGVLEYAGGSTAGCTNAETASHSAQVLVYCSWDAPKRHSDVIGLTSGARLEVPPTSSFDADACRHTLRLYVGCNGNAVGSLVCPLAPSGSRTASPTPTSGAVAAPVSTSCAAVPVTGSGALSGPSLLWKPLSSDTPDTLLGNGRATDTGRELYSFTLSASAGDEFTPWSASVTTALVSDVIPGYRSSTPRDFRPVVQRPNPSDGSLVPSTLLYFYATVNKAPALHVSDGTTNGTCAVALSGVPSGAGTVTLSHVSGSQLMFSSAATAAYPATVFVAQAPLAGSSACPATLTLVNSTLLYRVIRDPAWPVQCGGYLWFVGREASSVNRTLRLWRAAGGAGAELGGSAPSMIAGLQMSEAPGPLACVRGHSIIAAARSDSADVVTSAPFGLFAVSGDGSWNAMASALAGDMSDIRWLSEWLAPLSCASHLVNQLCSIGPPSPPAHRF